MLGVCTTHCSLVEYSHVYSSLVLATTAVDLTHREREQQPLKLPSIRISSRNAHFWVQFLQYMKTQLNTVCPRFHFYLIHIMYVSITSLSGSKHTHNIFSSIHSRSLLTGLHSQREELTETPLSSAPPSPSFPRPHIFHTITITITTVLTHPPPHICTCERVS